MLEDAGSAETGNRAGRNATMYDVRIERGGTDNMKAITVIQPWANLLAEGAKIYETRSWKTNYRGEILIHAGKKDPLFGICAMGDEAWENACIALGIYGTINRYEWLPTGVIVGKATLTDCILITQEFAAKIKADSPAEYSFGDFTPGRYAWKMEWAAAFDEPVRVNGKQGLWNYDGPL